jgi:gliding motility-associated-like protein
MRQLSILIITLFCLSSLESNAQVAAPEFLCVSGDSLFWELPQNNCGAFNAYVIYASQNINGPYSVLSTITDPTQDAFYHEDPGVSTWYYYLESDYDCPGEAVLQSDTLDNEIPEMPIIEFVSVDGNNVNMSWTPSPSPEVIGYIISRNVPGQGTLTIDTVFVGNTYTDVNATPNLNSETYFLEALDACGNRSLITNPHRTVFLEANPPDSCRRSIELSWSVYTGWQGGINRQEVWVSKDGAPATLAATVDNTLNSVTVNAVDDQAEYCVTVRVIANDSETWVAASNEVCVFAEVVQRQSYLLATNASVNADNSVSLSWLWDADAQLAETAILRSADNNNFSDLDRSAPAQPLPNNGSYIDGSAAPDQGAVFYQIESIDECGEEVVSNAVGTIYLQAIANNTTNELNWTPFVNDQATVVSYQLYRATQSNTTLIGTFDNSTFSAVDQIDTADPEQLQACYYVEAEAALISPEDSSALTIQSRSNISCAIQDANIYVPNAFSPNADGRNDEFIPYLQYGAPEDYRMVIYDRWGGQRFISTDINQGWDGMTKGVKAPTGLYIYHLYLRQPNGTEIERTGEISLIR